MQKRHEAELAALAGGSGAAQSSTTTAAPAPAASSSVPAAAEPAQAKAKSKAAKKREAKEKEELERQARVKDEKANTVSARQVELDAIARRLVPLHLEIKEMPSDGDCLFAAVADQLSAASRAQKSSQTIKSLRALAASHIRAHKADFEPFLLAIDDGLGDDGIEGYCTRLETTKLWGGEVEIRVRFRVVQSSCLSSSSLFFICTSERSLQALSEALRVPVVVYSADMAPHVVGGEADPLRVSFHKHYLSLGAHYNSVVPALGAEQP
jgi:OTU domain-containing protein 6